MLDSANTQYSNQMGGDSLPSSHSTSSSFSNGSPDAWDNSTVYTPISTPRRGSPNETKYQSALFSVPTPTSSPDRYVAVNGFCAMNNLTQNSMTIYHQPQPNFSGVSDFKSIPNHHIPDFNSYGPYHVNSMAPSFVSNDGLPISTPSLIDDDMFSPVSDLSCSVPTLDNYVAPSQTTIDAFGLQSPLNPVKSLNFHVNYGCQPAGFDNSFLMNCSSPEDAGYLVQEYHQYKSEHSTPSRQSSQRHNFEQSQESQSPINFRHKPTRESAEAKKNRIASKRAGKICTYNNLSNGIGLNPKATNPCLWPGCKKMFARSEHQKRHQRTHKDVKEPCIFCEKPFSTTRQDNLLTHVKLHRDAKKTSRTKYYPGAAAWIRKVELDRSKSTALKLKGEEKAACRIAKTRR